MQKMENNKILEKIWNIFSKSQKDNLLGILVDGIVYTIIIGNTLLLALYSFHSIMKNTQFIEFYNVITMLSVCVLSIALLIRFISCTAEKRYSQHILGRFKFILSPMTILELFVIVSIFYFGVEVNLIFLLLFKVFNISEYLGDDDNYAPVLILKKSFLNKKEELFITILISLGLMFLSAFIVFKFEAPVQPEKFTNIIPSISWVFGVLTGTNMIEFTPITLIGQTFHVIMIILGIVIIGLPVGILTGSFIEEISESKKKKQLNTNSNIILRAMELEQKITVRKLVDKFNLTHKRKVLDVDFLMARMVFSQETIFSAINFSDNLRLRACKQSIEIANVDNLVIESFDVNTSFGSFIKRDSNIHVISTQSIGDLGIGHFSYILADALQANYYSNEFFSSANLLPETRLNFAVNEWYNNNDDNIPEPFKEWRNILNNNIKKGDIVLYFGTGSLERVPFAHVLCGGKKGDIDFMKIENPIFDDINKIKYFFDLFSDKMKALDMPITSHSEFGNTNKNHLCQVLRNSNKANVLSLFISQKLLQFKSLDTFYTTIATLRDCIKKTLLS